MLSQVSASPHMLLYFHFTSSSIVFWPFSSALLAIMLEAIRCALSAWLWRYGGLNCGGLSSIHHRSGPLGWCWSSPGLADKKKKKSKSMMWLWTFKTWPTLLHGPDFCQGHVRHLLPFCQAFSAATLQCSVYWTMTICSHKSDVRKQKIWDSLHLRSKKIHEWMCDHA